MINAAERLVPMPIEIDDDCTRPTTRVPRRIGRPPKERKWKRLHPGVQFPSLLAEMCETGGFISSLVSGALQAGRDYDDQDRLMALQQLASRIDEMHCLLHSLKVAVACCHPDPYRIIGHDPVVHGRQAN